MMADKITLLQDKRVSFVGEYSMSDINLSITDEIRSYCEQNLCGQYGKNWACPPYVPSVDICRGIVGRYQNMILFRTTFPRKDVFDLMEMYSAAKEHQRLTSKVRGEFSSIFEGKFLILGAGGCGNCEKCSCPDGSCVDPKRKINSIESYAIDLDSFLLENNISRRGGNEEQSFFTMIFYRPVSGSS